jgi:hypothetical protein
VSDGILLFTGKVSSSSPSKKKKAKINCDIDYYFGKGSRVRYHLCLLLRVRVGGYIVNLLDFYSYRLIGKLTAFSHLQEFSHRNLPVEDSFTFAARFSLLG